MTCVSILHFHMAIYNFNVIALNFVPFSEERLHFDHSVTF